MKILQEGLTKLTNRFNGRFTSGAEKQYITVHITDEDIKLKCVADGANRIQISC
jgi:uncharacterized membrane-anchored protein